jgi:hypothetical protein
MLVIPLMLMLASMAQTPREAIPIQRERIPAISMPLATADDRADLSRPQDIEGLERHIRLLKQFQELHRRNANLMQEPGAKSWAEQVQRDLKQSERQLERLRKPKQ